MIEKVTALTRGWVLYADDEFPTLLHEKDSGFALKVKRSNVLRGEWTRKVKEWMETNRKELDLSKRWKAAERAIVLWGMDPKTRGKKR